MSVHPKGKRGIYWWDFRFAGQRHQASTKTTSRTVALRAEEQRKRELEAGYNNVKEIRKTRVRMLEEIINEYLEGYRVRYRSATFAEYALGHVSRLLGKKMIVDINEAIVLRYQEDRLREKAAPKSINEEVRFLLKMLGNPSGDLIRGLLKEKKMLKLAVEKDVGKAFDTAESSGLELRARKSHSPHMYPAYMLARNAALRDGEIKTLQWERVDLDKRTVRVGRAKTEAGRGRIVPLNDEVYEALMAHRVWYLKKFGETRAEWYVFPWGRPRPIDPTRHITSFKTAWKTVKRKAEVKGRWHDNRHTLLTELAEAGAHPETIKGIAGHIDPKMAELYSHIRQRAKREALHAVDWSARSFVPVSLLV
jgi:integrase